MAEKIVSPGVFTRENDVRYLAQGIGNIGAAIIGPFSKGPAFLPTVVNTQSEFEEIFGTPDGTYYTGYTVQNYLREAGTVTIVKVGHTGGYEHITPLAIAMSGSNGNILSATLFSTNVANEALGFASSTLTATSGAAAFNITVTGSVAISASVLQSATNDISDVFGLSPNGSKSTYGYTYFENASTNQFASYTSSLVNLVELPTQDFTDDTLQAVTPWIQSQLVSGERYDLFRFHTLGHGTYANKEFKVSIYNVKTGTASTNYYPTFSLMLRGYDDTDKRKTILELYQNANLNPASPNYLPKLIGDMDITIDSNGKISEVGDYGNKSKYIRVQVSADGSFPSAAAPFAHGAYINPINVTGTTLLVPAVVFTTGSDENTSGASTKFAGIDLETTDIKTDNNFYLNPIPASAVAGQNTVFSFDGDINALENGVVNSTFNFGYTLADNTIANINKRQFTVAFQEGFDGISPTVPVLLGADITDANTQGFDLSTSLAEGSVAYMKAINAVANPDEWDINLVSAPGVIRRLHSYVFDNIVDMCETREDAFFIGDVTATNDTIAQAVEQGQAVDSNYVGTYYPWVKTIDTLTNKLIAVPPSVLMPAIYASNDAIAAEWWAPAGLNRGGVVGAVSVLNRLTHAERDELYEGKINPIAAFPGQGIAAYGQKTLQEATSALDRINVRRLLIKVKKYIASTSRYLVFEQNTSITRNKFTNTVNPYLEGIQQRQGLYTFKVVMDESNNTPDVIDRNMLVGQIYLQPAKTAEFIVLDFNIMPTGASFSG
jgi:hypothetical protein